MVLVPLLRPLWLCSPVGERPLPVPTLKDPDLCLGPQATLHTCLVPKGLNHGCWEGFIESSCLPLSPLRPRWCLVPYPQLFSPPLPNLHAFWHTHTHTHTHTPMFLPLPPPWHSHLQGVSVCIFGFWLVSEQAEDLSFQSICWVQNIIYSGSGLGD